MLWIQCRLNFLFSFICRPTYKPKKPDKLNNSAQTKEEKADAKFWARPRLCQPARATEQGARLHHHALRQAAQRLGHHGHRLRQQGARRPRELRHGPAVHQGLPGGPAEDRGPTPDREDRDQERAGLTRPVPAVQYQEVRRHPDQQGGHGADGAAAQAEGLAPEEEEGQALILMAPCLIWEYNSNRSQIRLSLLLTQLIKGPCIMNSLSLFVYVGTRESLINLDSIQGPSLLYNLIMYVVDMAFTTRAEKKELLPSRKSTHF